MTEAVKGFRTGFRPAPEEMGLPGLVVPSFYEAGVRHLYTLRDGGVSQGIFASLNFRAGAGDEKRNIMENFARVARAMDRPLPRFTLTRQVHGDEIAVVREADVGRGMDRPAGWSADGLITDLPGVTLGGFYADCALWMFFDPSAPAVGVAHAGWRGTALDVPAKTVRRMTEQYGADPGRMMAAVGPAICKNCFETDDDVPQEMIRAFGESFCAPFLSSAGAPGRWKVDLAGLSAARLVLSGLAPEHITLSGVCTACGGGRFWSHRRTKGARGVHGGFISL